MGLSKIENELTEAHKKEIQKTQLKQKQHEDYLKDKAIFLAKYTPYLTEIEDTFWEMCTRFGRLIKREIISYYRRKRLLFIIPLSSIKEGKIYVCYEPEFHPSANLSISIEIEKDDRRHGAWLKFRGHCLTCSSSYDGMNLPATSYAEVVGELDLSKFDRSTANVWLDDMFEKLYRSLKHEYPKEIQ